MCDTIFLFLKGRGEREGEGGWGMGDGIWDVKGLNGWQWDSWRASGGWGLASSRGRTWSIYGNTTRRMGRRCRGRRWDGTVFVFSKWINLWLYSSASICSTVGVSLAGADEWKGHLPPYRAIQYPDQAPSSDRDGIGGERWEYRAAWLWRRGCVGCGGRGRWRGGRRGGEEGEEEFWGDERRGMMVSLWRASRSRETRSVRIEWSWSGSHCIESMDEHALRSLLFSIWVSYAWYLAAGKLGYVGVTLACCLIYFVMMRNWWSRRVNHDDDRM